MNKTHTEQLHLMLENIMTNAYSMSRQNLGVNTNTQDRFTKIEYAAGYPEIITTEDYYNQWKRNAIARRLVSAFPDETWRIKPHVYETDEVANPTPFEKTWLELDRRVGFISAMATADRLCGIGRFGIILIGLDDGKDLHEPVEGFDDDYLSTTPGAEKLKHRVTFARPISERFVRIDKFVHDVTDPRNGLPEYYSVSLNETTDEAIEHSDNQLDQTTVHWTRVIHITEETDESPVFASPRMQPVFNDLLDLLKISAGSPEAYWQSALPGLTFKLDPGYDAIDEESLRLQMEEYADNMRRYISTVGVTVNALAPNVTDPSPHVDQKLTMISIGTGIPKRILLGTESGRLAGDQDGENWQARIQTRRVNHVDPKVIRHSVHHLQRMGCLERVSEVQISWGVDADPSDLETAEVAKLVTESLAIFVSSGLESLMSFGDYLHLILKRPMDEVEMILDKLDFDDTPGHLVDAEIEREENRANNDAQRALDAAAVITDAANNDADNDADNNAGDSDDK